MVHLPPAWGCIAAAMLQYFPTVQSSMLAATGQASVRLHPHRARALVQASVELCSFSWPQFVYFHIVFGHWCSALRFFLLCLTILAQVEYPFTAGSACATTSLSSWHPFASLSVTIISADLHFVLGRLHFPFHDQWRHFIQCWSSEHLRFPTFTYIGHPDFFASALQQQLSIAPPSRVSDWRRRSS